MSPAHALEIQEITDQISTYLNGKDLAICARVSKSWRDIFLPHRWRVVRVGFSFEEYLGTNVHFGPDRDHIYSHRHLIQDLSLISELAGLHVYQYPNLRHLMIDTFGIITAYKHNPMDRISGTPSLVDLELSGVDFVPGFWETLSGHPHIRNLALSNASIKADDTLGFWKMCMKLKGLRMRNFFFRDGVRPRNMVFDRMRKLDMNGADLIRDAHQLDLILQSPKLESLEWEIGRLKGISKQASNRPWPLIRKLHIFSYAEDMDWAFLLNGIGANPWNIVDLRLHGWGLDKEAFRALSVHFSTLVKVDFRGKWDISCMSLDVLRFCPRLEILKTWNVAAKDVVERGPWVCQQLRELKIYFRFSPSEQSLQPMVFERLSALVRLEQLTIEYPAGSTDRDFGLDFRLDCGLGRLASLRQLTDLSFDTSSDSPPFPQLEMEDVTWMVNNWKKLRRVKGPLNGDKEVKARLVNVFESHGINVQ